MWLCLFVLAELVPVVGRIGCYVPDADAGPDAFVVKAAAVRLHSVKGFNMTVSGVRVGGQMRDVRPQARCVFLIAFFIEVAGPSYRTR